VHCSDAELVDFPWTLPEETTELYLQRNNLTAVPRTVVRDLHHLKVLNIANNWISIVNAETVARALQLDAFVLYGNPLHCSCELLQLAKIGSISKDDQGLLLEEVVCHTPRSVMGKSLNQLDFSCGLERTVRSPDNQSFSGSGSGMENDTSGLETPSATQFVTRGSEPPTTAVFQLPSESSSRSPPAVDLSSWFLLEFDNGICSPSVMNHMIENHFRQNLVSTLNSNVCQKCHLMINNTVATLHCGTNAVLNVTLTVETAHVPARVSAVNLTDYYLNNYLGHIQNRSADSTISFNISGVAYSLKRFCSQSRNDCPVASRPTIATTVLTPTDDVSESNGVSKETIAIITVCSVSLLILWTIMVIWFYRNVYSKGDDRDTVKAKKFWNSLSVFYI
jgi:hypothetical protein